MAVARPLASKDNRKKEPAFARAPPMVRNEIAPNSRRRDIHLRATANLWCVSNMSATFPRASAKRFAKRAFLGAKPNNP
jgi:hypothetical protein